MITGPPLVTLTYTVFMNRRNAVRLFASLGIAGATLTAQEKQTESKEKRLSTEELDRLLQKRENLFFLDVREPKELEELGTIKGYVNIPLGQLESRLSEIPKDKLIITA